MGKLFVRLTITFTAIYFITAFLGAQIFGVDILAPSYNLLFESCVVIYSFSEGKYHCKYIKYTALAILLSDAITQLDNYYEILTVNAHNIIPIIIMGIGIIIGIFLAIRHYVLVIKLKRLLNERDI